VGDAARILQDGTDVTNGEEDEDKSWVELLLCVGPRGEKQDFYTRVSQLLGLV
jgi:hypothetical protein